MRGPRSASMAAVALLAMTGGAWAQPTPAEQATRQLERGLAQDRMREAEAEASPALPADRGETATARDRVQQLDTERLGLMPEIGRPETAERPSPADRPVRADPNIQP